MDPSAAFQSPMVLPPLAPGYAWTLTPHGWYPMPYGGPMLAPVPYGAPPMAAPPRSTWTEAPALPPATPSTSATSAPDLLADIPRAVRDLADHDGRIAGALGGLYEARETLAHARRATLATMQRYDAIPRDPAQARALAEQLVRERPDVCAAWNHYEHARAAAERATQALTDAAKRYATSSAPPASPPAPAEPPPAPVAAPQLDAAPLDVAHLRERDPAVARALDAHTEATEHAQATGAQLAEVLAPHGPGPEEPSTRAAWIRATAERDPAVAIALGAALAAFTVTEQTAAQLAATLAPYAARAPPRA